MSVIKRYSPEIGPSFASLQPGASALTQIIQGGMQVTALSAAQIIAMFTTQVAITPVPGTGKAVVIDSIVAEIIRTSTQFTGGGVVQFQYHGQTTEIMSATIAAASVTGAAGTSIFRLAPVATSGGSVVTSAVAVEITNLTGVFAAGTGTAKIYTRYHIITL